MKNDNIIFIICLVIAFVFWGLIKLSKFYEVSYIFNIQYTNVPVDKRLTSMTDSTLQAEFRARGFFILRINLFEEMSQLPVDLENCTLEKSGTDYFVNTSELLEVIASKTNIPESDIRIDEAKIRFRLEDLFEKEVNVEANLNLSYKDQYDYYEKEIISPKSVKVFGPKSIIDTMNKVSTVNVMLQNIDKDLVLDVGLLNPAPSLLNFDPNKVELRLRTEKYTESNIEIPIDFSEVKENIQAFPSTVKVYFKIAQKDFNNIQAGQFAVQPVLHGVDLQKTDRLNLKLVSKPSFIRNEWIVPSSVEFLITR